MRRSFIQWSITISAITLAAIHVIFPLLAIDAVVIALIAAAITPWLGPLFKKIKFPGGFEIEYEKNLNEAKENADQAGLLASPSELNARANQYTFELIATEDPNLALAGLRIEIEKRLLALAKSKGINIPRAGIGQLLLVLRKGDLLTGEQISALADMVGLLNSAVHGAEVSESATLWALDVGPRLLQSLEDMEHN
jgi:hypothetical protein